MLLGFLQESRSEPEAGAVHGTETNTANAELPQYATLTDPNAGTSAGSLASKEQTVVGETTTDGKDHMAAEGKDALESATVGGASRLREFSGSLVFKS